MADVDVTVEPAADADFLIKLQTPAWEVNIRMAAAEVAKLRAIREADWGGGLSIRAGESARAPVFWACERGVVTVMIGEDDETWDVAVTVPIDAVDAIVQQAR